MIRYLGFTLLASGVVFGQAMTEMSAAAAGGLVGAGAGKAVSVGLTSVLEKVDAAAKDAAADKDKAKEKPKAAPAPPVLMVGPVQSSTPVRGYSVPEPPPARNVSKKRASAAAEPAIPVTPVQTDLPPAPTAPVIPPVTLAEIEKGMDRDMVSRISSPAVKITMFDEGHLLEVYRYKEGVVRMKDGSVESVTRR